MVLEALTVASSQSGSWCATGGQGYHQSYVLLVMLLRLL